MLQFVKFSEWQRAEKTSLATNEGKFELNWKHGLVIRFNFVHINFNNLDVMKPTNNNNTSTDNKQQETA